MDEERLEPEEQRRDQGIEDDGTTDEKDDRTSDSKKAEEAGNGEDASPSKDRKVRVLQYTRSDLMI